MPDLKGLTLKREHSHKERSLKVLRKLFQSAIQLHLVEEYQAVFCLEILFGSYVYHQSLLKQEAF